MIGSLGQAWSAPELSMCWVDLWVGLGWIGLGQDFSVFGGLSWVGSTVAEVLLQI